MDMVQHSLGFIHTRRRVRGVGKEDALWRGVGQSKTSTTYLRPLESNREDFFVGLRWPSWSFPPGTVVQCLTGRDQFRSPYERLQRDLWWWTMDLLDSRIW